MQRGTGERQKELASAGQQRLSVGLEGLRACRLAALLTQKELADLVNSNQTTIADLETWEGADLRMLGELCKALKVAPEDLIFEASIDDKILEKYRTWRARNGFGDGDVQRRHQVNRIKRGARDTGAARTVLLRGLKDCRVNAGLSQRKLAEMIDSNQTTIQQLEKKYPNRGAYMKTIRKLCRALGVSPADLICRGFIE